MRALLLLLLLSACAGELGGSCSLERLVELPIQLIANVPVVPVEINGQRAALVLDTGSDATVLTRVAAARLGVAEGERRLTTGAAGGRAVLGVTVINRLALGGLELGAARALLADAPRPPLDGVLGLDVLSAFEVELDVPRGRVVFYRVRPCPGAQPGWIAAAVPLAAQQQVPSGHVFVPVVLDGQLLRGLLDTGASRSLLSTPAAEAVGVTRQELESLPGIQGQAINVEGIVVRRAVFRELRIGPDVIDAPALAITDLPAAAGDILVGSDYLGTRRVWFQLGLGRVWVERR